MSGSNNTTSLLEECGSRYTDGETIVLGIVLYIIAMATIGGNILVITSFFREKDLRSFGNYFILNLSFSDLVIGVLMTFYIPYMLTGCWNLTRAGCITFNVLDYAVPLSSTWNIALISLDRYLSVAKPIHYRLKQNNKLAIKLMFIPWIIGFVFYGPSVIFWEYWTGRQLVPDYQCYVEFYDNVPYLLSNSVIEFIIPFVIVAIINFLIYNNIRKRSQSLLAGNMAVSYSTNQTTSSMSPNQKLSVSTSQNTANSDIQHNKISPENPTMPTRAFSVIQKNPSMISLPTFKSSPTKGAKVSIASINADSKIKQSLARDRKTARSLAILVGVFLLTWAPYEICALINPMCDFCVPATVFDVVFWLLWINSTVNPLLYALLQVRFRNAFVRILCCGRTKLTNNVVIPLEVRQ